MEITLGSLPDALKCVRLDGETYTPAEGDRRLDDMVAFEDSVDPMADTWAAAAEKFRAQSILPSSWLPVDLLRYYIKHPDHDRSLHVAVGYSFDTGYSQTGLRDGYYQEFLPADSPYRGNLRSLALFSARQRDITRAAI